MIRRPPVWRSILALALFETAYYFAFQYGMTFSQASASPFWFPDSVLLCALLLTGPRQWWMFAIAALPVRLHPHLTAGIPAWFLLLTFAVDLTNTMLAATLLRRFSRDPRRLDSGCDFVFFCLFAVLLGPAISAFAGAAARHAVGYAYWAAWEQWFLGDALAQLVVTPAILFWVFGPWRKLITAPNRRKAEALVVALGIVASTVTAFSLPTGSNDFTESRFYAPITFLVWAALRFGMPGASGGIAILAFLCLDAELSGRGPFAGRSPEDTASAIQHFLILRAILAYAIAVLIDERKRVEQSLRESEGRFRQMADTAPVLIWMSDVDRFCNFFNQGWLEFTGRTLQQELGNGWAESVHADDVKHCLDALIRAFDARIPFELEYRLRRRDGEYRWLLDKGVPRFDAHGAFLGYIGVAIDIADRRTQEGELRAREQRYREVVESQTDPVCRYRADTTLTFVNEAFCHFFKKNREELVGVRLTHLVPARERELVPATPVPSGRMDGSGTFECEVACGDGRKRWQQWIVHPTNGDGRHEEFQATARDITERRNVEELLRATHQRLNHLAGQLIHAQEEERRRIARELHDDFNQRLAALAIGLSNLRNHIPKGNRTAFKRVNRLHDDAVVLSDEIRLIAHQLHPPAFGHDDLRSTFHSFCSKFSAMTRLPVDLVVSGEMRLRPEIAACCYRIVQEALQNIHKHAHARSVQVVVHLARHRVILLVADDGAGLDSNRLKTSRGLGVASMEERVRLLSGDFRIDKRPHGGTLISVEIPVV
jgi:PAS domain S-box-containing protein